MHKEMMKSLLETNTRKKIYDIYLVLANTIMLFVAVNLALAILFLARDKTSLVSSNQKTQYNDATETDWFDYTAYEGIVDQAYAAAVVEDFDGFPTGGFVYQPWVQFAEAPYSGRLLNIDVDSQEFPIRRTINPELKEKSSVLQIFTLGGSTTFGYYVSDEHTWPSYLSYILNKRAEKLGLDARIEVTNYGHVYYYTTQEVILLEQLLRRGQRPDLVIFLDGVNEWQLCKDAPSFTGNLQGAMHNLQFPATEPFFEWLPITKLAQAINRRLFAPTVDEKTNDCKSNLKTTTVGVDAAAQMGVDGAAQYEQNVKIAQAVAKLYDVETLIFLQPDARYNYNLDLFRNRDQAKEAFLPFKEYKHAFYREARRIRGVVDLTDLFEAWGSKRKAIVDDNHYSPNFNHFLAEHVADQIDISSLVKRHLCATCKLETTQSP
jgi:hypothetical protein